MSPNLETLAFQGFLEIKGFLVGAKKLMIFHLMDLCNVEREEKKVSLLETLMDIFNQVLENIIEHISLPNLNPLPPQKKILKLDFVKFNISHSN